MSSLRNFFRKFFAKAPPDIGQSGKHTEPIIYYELKVRKLITDGRCTSIEVQFAMPDHLKQRLAAIGFDLEEHRVAGGMTNLGGYDITKRFVSKNGIHIAEVKPFINTAAVLRPMSVVGEKGQDWNLLADSLEGEQFPES
jgi:hypothetical protein